MNIPVFITILLLIITLNYCVLMLLFRSGIIKLHKSNAHNNSGIKRLVSVIVSARNEEDNIGRCLQCLFNQDYPADKFEVLIVDDQSNDRTAEVIQKSLSSYPLNARVLKTTGNGGKKQAVKIALQEAIGEIILTTDADCLVPASWITLMNDQFEETGAVFVAGPVRMIEEKGLFSKFQCLEFNSLMAATAGSFGLGMPVMSNGANMGFVAEAYDHDMLFEKQASGEDVFTMFSLKKKFGRNRVVFLHDPEAVVLTHTQKTIGQFVMQRLRWTSKSSSYKDKDVIYTAITVFAMNFSLMLAGIMLLIPQGKPRLVLALSTLIAFALKTISDFLLVQKYSGLYVQKSLVKYLVLFEPVVIVYTTLTGILGNLVSFKWKGRRYN